MEIGISTSQLIDIGLNSVGFLAAGMLFMLIRSLWNERRRKPLPEVTSESAASMDKEPYCEIQPEREPAPGIEYINFGGRKSGSRNTLNDLSSPGNPRLRNRQEIIELAKRILAGGEDGGRLSTLPITDGELSLIRQNLNLQGAGRN